MSLLTGKSENVYRKKAVLAVLISTGARIGEVVNMKIRDIQFDARYMIVHGSKGKADRMIPLPSATIRFINQYLEKRVHHSEYLFVNNDGQQYTVSGIQQILRRFLHKKALIKRGTPHLFRHTFVTRLYLETKDPELTQYRAGHSDYSTTKNYIHLANNYKSMNVEFESIDILLAKCIKL